MRGGSMLVLSRRLQKQGFECSAFTYASVQRSPGRNADHLHEFVASIQADEVHFVGHSLGGIVLLHLFDRHPQQPPGRVVLLGSPVKGSNVARANNNNALLRMILGRSTQGGVLGEVPEWKGGRDLGIIAGTRPLGMGRLLGGLQEHSDGTVAVKETRLDDATDFLTLPVTHTGLVLSASTANQVAHFLREGEFKSA